MFSSNHGTSFISNCVMGQRIHWFIQHEALQPPLPSSPREQNITTTLVHIPLGTGPQTRTFDMQGQRAGGKATALGSVKSRPRYGRAQGSIPSGELAAQCPRYGKPKSTVLDTGSWIWNVVIICIKTLPYRLIYALRHATFAKTT